jgi:hypothetical protein
LVLEKLGPRNLGNGSDLAKDKFPHRKKELGKVTSTWKIRYREIVTTNYGSYGTEGTWRQLGSRELFLYILGVSIRKKK